MSSLISGLILIAIFFAVMIALILWIRKQAKNLKKEGKISAADKLRKLQK